MIIQFGLFSRVRVDHVERLVEFNPEIVVATCVQIPVRGELHKATVLNFERRLVRVHFVFARFRVGCGVQVKLVTLPAVGMPRDEIGVDLIGAIANTEPRAATQPHVVSDLIPLLVIGYLQTTLVG